MKPEELKIIAEGMGYKVNLLDDSGPMLNKNGVWLNGNSTPYNPLTNDTQCMEIMEKHDCFTSVDEDGTKLASFPPHRDNFICKGKTINEAVCKAALEHFKK